MRRLGAAWARELSLHCCCILIRALLQSLRAFASLQNKSRIDIGRLRRLSSAFSNYTVEGLTASSAPVLPAGPRQPTAALDKTTAEALKLVFRTEGSYAQVRPMLYENIS